MYQCTDEWVLAASIELSATRHSDSGMPYTCVYEICGIPASGSPRCGSPLCGAAEANCGQDGAERMENKSLLKVGESVTWRMNGQEQ